MNKFIITEDQLNKVLNYLGTQPYVNVTKLIQILTTLTLIKEDEPKKDDKGKK